MLSSALVIFREVFEIVLIVGIVLAATCTMPNRAKAIALGFGSGLVGSALVALFTGKISDMAEGLGQEYFNAAILLTAAAFIGWTVLWMKKHSRHLKKHFSDMGQAVSEGRAPYFMLSAIIALAMLREGSEIVLFTYGMLATGVSIATIGAGALIGSFAGLVVGLALYFGLIKLSVKIFMQATGTMLVLLVAGMVLQAFGFLVAAGEFESLSNVVWDSSAFLDDGGLIGQSLGTLVGYTARPTTIQLIAYLTTLMGMIIMMKLIDRNISFASFFKTATAASAVLVLLAGPANATKTVTSPYVTKGELELKWKGGYTHDDDDQGDDGAWAQKATVEYGVTDRFQVEAEAEVENPGDSDNTDLTALALEGKIELTEQGQYWVDVGLKGAYEFNLADGADKVEAKLLLAKDTGKLHHRANLILEREVGNESDDETDFGVAVSSRYKMSKMFEPGVELYSDFGSLSDSSDFDDEDHRMGPVAYGKLGEFKYEAGYLFGLSDSAPDGMLKAVVSYEWNL